MHTEDTTARAALGPVVVGVDGSPGSLRAVAVAAVEAALRGVRVDLVHVALHGGDDPEQEAADLVRRVAPGVATRAVRRTGPAAAALVEASRDADLLVVGSRGHGPVTDALVGSVALEAAAHAACPVLIVGGGAGALAEGPVVVGVEGTARDLGVLEFGFREARLSGVSLVAVHGWPAVLSPLAAGVARLLPDTEALVDEAVRDVLVPFTERFPEVPVTVRAITHEV